MSSLGISQRDALIIAGELDQIELAVRKLEQSAGAVPRDAVTDIQSPRYGIAEADDLDIAGLVATPGISNAMISWQAPPQVLVRFYDIEIADDNAFTSFESFRVVDTRFQYRLAI